MHPAARAVAAAALSAVLLSACSCSTHHRPLANCSPGSPLYEARAITAERGLVEARDFVFSQLAEIDSSHGEMESRMAATTADPGFVFPDSLSSLDASQRAKVALVIVPGTRVRLWIPSKTRDTLSEAAARARSLGFDAHLLDTPLYAAPSENAAAIARELVPIVAGKEHVLLMMLSKGAHDMAFFLQDHAAHWPPEERAKLKAVISLAGTVQGSVAAAWMASSPHPAPVLLRCSLRAGGQGHIVAMLGEIGTSPWDPEILGRLSQIYPNMTWISVAMIPDGEDGRVTEKVWMPHMRHLIEEKAPFFSPEDGLVESMASVLPDGSGLPQWVIRGFGSHILTNGRYPDGTRIAPQTTVEGVEKINPQSGAEVIDAFLRALPSSLLFAPAPPR